ncbi:MAG: histidine kinase [Myxococcota bacterium]
MPDRLATLDIDIATLLVELAEKMGLIAAAAVVAVLIPQLRNRVLGVGRRRDKLMVLALGLALSLWGAVLGPEVLGEHLNVRAIGILIAGILAGWKTGALTGLGAGLFYASRVDPETAPWVLAGSVIDGVLAGLVRERRPQWFEGFRTFFTAAAVQLVHLVVVGVGLFAVGHASRYLPAWPAHLVKLLVNAAGVTLFVLVLRQIVSAQQNAVALVEARATANRAALEALRRRLEPHFLFNAFNTLRATIRTDPGRAREMVNDLSDLYRYLLSHPEDASLREELNHAVAYLAIERARLGDDRLALEQDIAPEHLDHRVPALLLQPLVENAVKHGIGAHEGNGKIRIGSELDGDCLVIRIQNRSEGKCIGPTEPGSGTALDTLRKRLEKIYGGKASLTLEIEHQRAEAIVRMPQRSMPEDHRRRSSAA